MIKKLLITLAILVLALALVACGGEASNDTTPPADEATEHTHVYNEEIVASTCTTAGSRKMVCACGDVQSEEALGFADHTLSTPDCEKDTVCTVCNAVLVPATGHTVGTSELISAPTCATAGKEKGTCLVCGKSIENELPATGHIPAEGAAITAVDGGFATTCKICGQTATLKAQTPAFKLTFEGDLAAESANEIGLEVYKPETWKIIEANGSKAMISEGKSVYINISDPAKLANLGTFVISFDYMTTKEANAGATGSIFSQLNNFYNGTGTGAGSTNWGWFIKSIEDSDVLATVVAEFSAANSIAFQRNVNYNIQLVISPAAKGALVFVNGTYIGKSVQALAFSALSANNVSFRIGDGPNFGHVLDNLTISALK